MDGTQSGPPARSLGVSSGEFRAVQRDTQTFEAVPALVVTPGEPPTAPQPNLHYVFDDPNDGEPGRDRVRVHILWELALAVGIMVAGFALVKARTGALEGESLRDLALGTAVVGLLALASAVGLRAAVPNLAVGALAVFAAYQVADHADGAWSGPAGQAVGLCAAIGLLQGLLVVGLHVPAWAASLGVALAVAGWVTTQAAVPVDVGYDAGPDAFLWLVGVVSASVVASVIGAIAGIRRGFGRYRPVADPAKRRSTAAAVIAVTATVAASAIAGLAGALLTTGLGTNLDPGDELETVVLLTGTGLATALLGGTSAYGRRGGIFGTVLAACLVVLAMEWVVAAHPGWSPLIAISIAIGIGLAVTRLVERYGRPVLVPPEEDESWMPRVHTPATTTPPWRPGPTPTGGLWSSDEGWGSPHR